MADLPSDLFNILWTVWLGSPAEKSTALTSAAEHLRSLSPSGAAGQLTYRGGSGRGVPHMLPLVGSSVPAQAIPFLSLMLERSRESCGATALMSLVDVYGRTPLHYFAYYGVDLRSTKMVLREHPPSLSVLNTFGSTPLRVASIFPGRSPERAGRAAFFRAAAAAFASSDLVALEALCGGSSPYLSREIGRQATSLSIAVAISLNRQESAPSPLPSPSTAAALSLLFRLRDFGRAGDSSDLLRRVLEYVGPYASPCDEGLTGGAGVEDCTIS